MFHYGNNEKVNKLQILQNKAARITNFAQARSSAKPLLKKLSLISLRDDIMIQNCLFVQDAIKNRTPEPFFDYFEINKSTHNTRSSEKALKIPSTNTVLYQLKPLAAMTGMIA